MSNNTRCFARTNELTFLYRQVEEGGRLLAVFGPSGIGKTTLLRELGYACSKNPALFPVYSLCKGNVPTTCNVATIEQRLHSEIFHPLRVPNAFGAVLLNRLRRDAAPAPSTDGVGTLTLMPLLERFLEPDDRHGYAISPAEATECFGTTLNNAVAAVGTRREIVLIIDSEGLLGDELADLLLSAVNRCLGHIKLVVAFEVEGANPAAELLRQRFDWNTTLQPFSADVVSGLVADSFPRAPQEFVLEVVDSYHGDPLTTDAAIQVASLNSAADRPKAGLHSPSYSELAKSLYRGLTKSSKAVVNALSVIHDGADTDLLAEILQIPKHEIIRICSEEPVITTALTPDAENEVHADLYHLAFKQQVETFLEPKQKAELRRKTGITYLNALHWLGTRLSYGAALSIPGHLADDEPSLFVTGVLRTLPLSILLGDIRTTKRNVLTALGKTRDPFEQAMLLTALSLLLLEEGNLVDATTRSFEALSNLRRTSQPQIIQAHVLGILAYLLQLQGRLTEALRCEEQALDVMKRFSSAAGDSGGLSPHLSNIALLHQKLGNQQLALQHYREALAVDQRTDNVRGIASDLRRIGGILQDMGQLDGAIDSHRQALEIDARLNDLHAIAWDSGNLGVTLSLKGQHREALECLQRALDMFGTVGSESEAAQIRKLIDEITADSKP